MDINYMQTRRVNLPLVVAFIKLWLFRPVKLLIGFGYVVLIGDGLRNVVPALGMKLFHMPFLGALKEYEVWHKLDLAFFAALLLFALTSSIWCALLELWLFDRIECGQAGRKLERYEQCLTAVGGVILVSDACLFYRAMTMVAWGGNVFSLSSLICTLAYVAVLVSVCVMAVNLKRNYLSLKLGIVP